MSPIRDQWLNADVVEKRLCRRAQRVWLATALTITAAVLGAGCAAAETASGDDIPNNYPTIAPASVQGRFDVVEIVVGADSVDLDGAVAPTISFDVVTGELQIEPDCNLYLGSFTLSPDGSASMTVTGGTKVDCPSGPDHEDRVLAAFAAIDRWAETSDGIELRGSQSTRILLRRI